MSSMFCKQCGSLLKAKEVNGKKVIGCSCGYSQESSQIKFSHKEKSEDIQVVTEEEPSTKLLIDEECPKCSNPQIYY